MPKIYFNCPAGVFDAPAKDALADELTSIALNVEGLPDTPFVRSTVWIYFHEYPAANVYHGGSNVGTNVISLEVNVIEGGLDDAAKVRLIEQFTVSIGKRAGSPPNELIPVYIVIREVPANNWGMFGKRTTLAAIKETDVNLKPI